MISLERRLRRLARPGPKYKEIDPVQLDKLLELHLRLTDVADFFDVSEDTIERFVKRTYKKKFAEYADKKRSRTRRLLMQKFWEKVKDGNMAAIIFGLENIMDWHDNVKTESTDGFAYTKK